MVRINEIAKAAETEIKRRISDLCGQAALNGSLGNSTVGLHAQEKIQTGFLEMLRDMEGVAGAGKEDIDAVIQISSGLADKLIATESPRLFGHRDLDRGAVRRAKVDGAKLRKALAKMIEETAGRLRRQR